MALPVVAVDFGALSIRMCRIDLDARPPTIEVLHRYAHGPVPDEAGRLRWDWPRLVAEMEYGLSRALESGPLASIGIDTWGVDYGLVDDRNELVAAPFSYRDKRTDGYRNIVDRIGEASLYATTGIQLQPFNTLFQLAVHDRGEMARARAVVMLPELLAHHLTGVVSAERTSVGTTALVDITTGDWSEDLCAAIDLDPALLPPIAPAGTLVGTWRDVPVHLVGGHDTASAVVAMSEASTSSSAFVSAGTWVLVGREQELPDTSETARAANFTNEAGAMGGIRFLKNLAGAWLVEGCREAWGSPPLGELLDAAMLASSEEVFDVTDPRFLAPFDMLAEVTDAAGLPIDAEPAVVVRTIVDSMAASTAAVIELLGGITDIHTFGGTSRFDMYGKRLSELTGLPVLRGPVEATALGNALVQGIALGAFTNLADARSSLKGAGA
jgi:rhamnulokinase